MNDFNNLINQFTGFLDLHLIYENQSISKYLNFEINSENILPENIDFSSIPEKLMLGKRVERFFELALIEQNRFEVSIKNLQIQNEKITIGELDFILKDKLTNQLIHVELVCKYYVLDNTSTDELWIGPNRKDGLNEKLFKLKNKQFPLLHKKETNLKLSELGINTNEIEQQLCFKASLFVPKSMFLKKYDFKINTNCIVGYWIGITDFTSTEYANCTFHIPIKQDWLIKPEKNNCWRKFDIINNEIQSLLASKQTPLVWMKGEKETYERFFVVWW